MHHHHAGCCHTHPASNTSVSKARLLWVALLLIGSFALAEFVVGLASNSLALVAESGHMLSDCLALAVSLLATWIAAFPASSQATFGYRRVEILAALVNGVGLLAIAVWVGWEAIARLQAPASDILGLPMLITAGVGVVVNTLNAFLLHDHSHNDLNLRGAFLHMVADAVSSVGVLVAAIAIWLLGWNWADGGISLAVSILIALGALPLMRQSLDILLEKTPGYLNLDEIQAYLKSVDEIVAVDRLRVWAIAPGQETLTAELRVNVQDGAERDRLLHTIQSTIQQKFGIQDIILQLTSALPQSVNLSTPHCIELI